MIAVMLVAVPVLTTWLGSRTGYLASLVLYWCGFCIPVIILHIPAERRPAMFTPVLETRALWVPVLLAMQVGGLVAAALLPNLWMLSFPAIALGALMGLVNGTLEEAAWRGGFLSRFAERRLLGFWLGLGLFVAWHVPLSLAQGIVFDGGALTLIGGTAGLGFLWSAIAWRTNSAFWPIAAHVLTNAVVFPVLLRVNGFV